MHINTTIQPDGASYVCKRKEDGAHVLQLMPECNNKYRVTHLVQNGTTKFPSIHLFIYFIVVLRHNQEHFTYAKAARSTVGGNQAMSRGNPKTKFHLQYTDLILSVLSVYLN